MSLEQLATSRLQLGERKEWVFASAQLAFAEGTPECEMEPLTLDWSSHLT